MKRNQPKQSSPVTHKTMVIPRELGELPSGWHQGLAPGSVADGGEPKSAIFRRFADPLIAGNESVSLLHTKYGIAMMGWNLAMIPAHARLQPLSKLLSEFADDLRLELKETLQYLVERKESRFVEYTWPIHSFHLEPKGTGVVLYVAAVNLEASRDEASMPDQHT
jgi:hypothetical protein